MTTAAFIRTRIAEDEARAVDLSDHFDGFEDWFVDREMRRAEALRTVVDRCEEHPGKLADTVKSELAALWATHPDYPGVKV